LSVEKSSLTEEIGAIVSAVMDKDRQEAQQKKWKALLQLAHREGVHFGCSDAPSYGASGTREGIFAIARH
jgi:hypothetical protein